MKKWTKNSKYPKSQICHFQGISLLTRDPSHSMPPKLPMIEKTSNQVPSNGIHFSKTFPSTTNFPPHQTCVWGFPSLQPWRCVSPMAFLRIAWWVSAPWPGRLLLCGATGKFFRVQIRWSQRGAKWLGLVVVVVGTARPWSSWAVWGRNMLCFFWGGVGFQGSKVFR